MIAFNYYHNKYLIFIKKTINNSTYDTTLTQLIVIFTKSIIKI